MVVSFAGRLGAAPEKKINNGNTFVTMSVFTDYYAKGQRESCVMNCVVFGARGETVMKYLDKGSKVFISGTLSLSSYRNRDGEEKTSLNVNVSDFDFMGTDQGNGQQQQTRSNNNQRRSAPKKQEPPEEDDLFNDDEDELPF